MDGIVDDIRRWAVRAYIEAGAAGLPCAELAVALAQAVLGHPEVQLALQALEGGPFAHARATQLASAVLARDAERAATRSGMNSDGRHG